MADFELVAPFQAHRRSAAGDRATGRRASRRRAKHQVLLGATGTGKTFTHQRGHRQGRQAHAGAGAQQDAGGAALQRVPRLLPQQRGRVLRQLLRLLPARGLPPAQRHLHREGLQPQRRDRQAAPRRHARPVRAPRRHHRGQRVLHLRPGRAGRLRRHRPALAQGRAGIAATACCGSWSTAVLAQRPGPLAGPSSASAATRSSCSRPTTTSSPASSSSATRSSA